MRVLVITHEYPPVGGGGGRAAQDICQELVNRGHAVNVLTAHLKGLPKREDVNDIQVTRISSGRTSAYRASIFAMAGFVLAATWACLWHIHKWRPDIIHVHFAVPSGPVAWLASRLTGIPYVLTAHLGDIPGGVPKKTASWFRWVFPFTPPLWRDAGQVIAVSEYARQLALAHYPVAIQVIPNGVDLTQLDPGTIKVNEPPQIIFAGRFMSQKNPLQLIQTLNCIKELNWSCLLAGDGPLRSDIELEIYRCNLEERIIFTGWITPDEVIYHLSNSDILFMPSLTESFPIAGVQAIAMGLAVVASRVGGFGEIVKQEQNGFLVNLNTPDGYAESLRVLLADTKRLHSFRTTSRKIAQKFDITRTTGEYEELFNRLISNG